MKRVLQGCLNRSTNGSGDLVLVVEGPLLLPERMAPGGLVTLGYTSEIEDQQKYTSPHREMINATYNEGAAG